MDGKSKNGEDKHPEEMDGKPRDGEDKHPEEIAGKSINDKDKHPNKIDGKSRNAEDTHPKEMARKSRKGKDKHTEKMAGKSRKSKDKQQEQPKEVDEVAQTLLSFLDPETANDIRRDLLPATVKQFAGECSKFIKKQLKTPDLREDLHRLTLKPIDVKDYFYPMLSDVEKKKGENNVCVYDVQGKDYKMDFKVLGVEKNYVLNSKNWVAFVNDHNLVEDQEITLWLFRHLQTKKLCFVIISERNDLATTSNATAMNEVTTIAATITTTMRLSSSLPRRLERKRGL